MTPERTAEILRIEKECVERQDTDRCNRDTNGCQCCDLIQETEDVLEAYNTAIAWADNYIQIQAELDYIKSYSERILGKWIDEGETGKTFRCSVCGARYEGLRRPNYCDECGAFMQSGLETPKERRLYLVKYKNKGHTGETIITATDLDELSRIFVEIRGKDAQIIKITKMEETT